MAACIFSDKFNTVQQAKMNCAQLLPAHNSIILDKHSDSFGNSTLDKLSVKVRYPQAPLCMISAFKKVNQVYWFSA